MNAQVQKQKAEQFRALHHTGKILLLPNVWDYISTRLVAHCNYPAIATASIATALANGYPDGEAIPFGRLLEVVRSIVQAAGELPVTVDIERGFAGSLPELQRNITQLITAGAVGINIEDSDAGHQHLTPVAVQCEKISAIREVARDMGVPLFINARTDAFISANVSDPVEESIRRADAYAEAGADGIFPIRVDTFEAITAITTRTSLPVNVLMIPPVADLKKLETVGVARVSLGPRLFSLALTNMKEAVEALLRGESQAFSEQTLLPPDALHQLL
jgi:2-methylisocitrate lyase-like PEP mutase family enzyme